MMRPSQFSALAFALTLSLASPCLFADEVPRSGDKSVKENATASPQPPSTKTPAGAKEQPVDRSGRKQHGKASYYSRRFTHKKTASGLPLDPNAKTAASKTLPLGTKAEVVNKENGKSTEVIINDRGPYVKDRVIDVTPKAADELGLKKEGTAQVEVKPVALPPPAADPKEQVIKAETEIEGKPPITAVAKPSVKTEAKAETKPASPK